MDADDQIIQHYDSVRRYAQHVVRDCHVADDVTQHTFYCALRDIRTNGVCPGKDRHAWLFTIARNSIRSNWRRRYSSPETGATSSADTPDHHAGVLDQLIALESEARVLDAVRKLPSGYSGILRGFYMEGKSCADLAEEYSMPATTVRVRLFRGREQLAKTLRDEVEP